MKRNLFMAIILPVLGCGQVSSVNLPAPTTSSATNHYEKVKDIPAPEGFARINGSDSAFTRWLRQIAIKSDSKVYLYNGELKRNQSAQFAVLDIPVGKKDLQQCADAVMRLRAAYLYSKGKYSRISFADNNGKKYNCPADCDYSTFEHYLEKVFMYCGTLSLEKQLRPVPDFTAIQPGDVLIKGGSPGHAVIVLDVARNNRGEKVYMLAQSYMPAQDIHILKNPANRGLSPWYSVKDANELIYTPEWTFRVGQLRRW